MAATEAAVQKRGERLSVGPKVKAVAIYAATMAASLLLLAWVFRLWRAGLFVPFKYSGDAVFTSEVIKGIIDNGGWYFQNQFVGAPWGQILLDFPITDNLHLLIIKAISFFVPDFAAVMNLFFLATFPLTAISSLFLFRRIGISYPVAMVGSLLFTFLPHHIFRGEGHLFLSAIFIIPLSVLAIVRICTGTPPFMKETDSGGGAFDFFSLRSAGYLLIALLTASAGLYYAFFACLLLGIAGLYAAVMHRSLKRLIVAAVIAGIIFTGLIANLLPSILYNQRYGSNEAVAQRQWREASFYGFTMVQLLSPVLGHRVESLRELRTDYSHGALNQNFSESSWSSLGIAGSAGLLFLLAWLALAKRRYITGENPYFQSLDAISVLNLFAILAGIVGGFGAMFAYLVSPQIRAYNRISMYIGLFSIMGLLLALEILRKKYVRSDGRRLACCGVLLLLLVVGILDQTNDSMVPDYAALNQTYERDEAFFQKIETSLPPQSMIFQLPYVPFPENPPVNAMADYDHLKAYLHTKTLRWSYGAMKGRDGDSWQRAVALEPEGQLLKDLAGAGFSGIYVDRAGYADGAAEIQRRLEIELGVKPLVDEDNRRLFFDMRDFARRLEVDSRSNNAAQSGMLPV